MQSIFENMLGRFLHNPSDCQRNYERMKNKYLKNLEKRNLRVYGIKSVPSTFDKLRDQASDYRSSLAWYGGRTL